MTNQPKNDVKIEQETESHKIASKTGFGEVLGSILEGIGALLAVFWPLLGAFWSFFGRSKSYLFKALVQDELQEAFWMDFGSLWEGFGTVLGRFWDPF